MTLRALAIVSLMALPACSPTPGANETAAGSDHAAVAGTAGPRTLALLGTRIRTARDKFVQLAEAVPEAQYDWRPAEGVRSFREVFIHVAADNWAPLWMDVPAPADAPVARNMDSLTAYQARRLDKDATRRELARSFDFILSAVDQTRDRLDQKVMFGTREWQVDEMWVALVTHMHEHLGQTIAYARSSGITPPWSQ